jgi:hypothetical protein
MSPPDVDVIMKKLYALQDKVETLEAKNTCLEATVNENGVCDVTTPRPQIIMTADTATFRLGDTPPCSANVFLVAVDATMFAPYNSATIDNPSFPIRGKLLAGATFKIYEADKVSDCAGGGVLCDTGADATSTTAFPAIGPYGNGENVYMGPPISLPCGSYSAVTSELDAAFARSTCEGSPNRTACPFWYMFAEKDMAEAGAILTAAQTTTGAAQQTELYKAQLLSVANCQFPYKSRTPFAVTYKGAAKGAAKPAAPSMSGARRALEAESVGMCS